MGGEEVASRRKESHAAAQPMTSQREVSGSQLFMWRVWFRYLIT